LRPQPFSAADDPAVLAVALGATLYCPATRPALARDIAKQAERGLVSTVVCLEDSIADAQLAQAEVNAVDQLRRYAQSDWPRPMIFVRVRHAGHIAMIIDGLGEYADVIAGFVLPKFTEHCGAHYLEAIEAASIRAGRVLLAMPVIESPDVAHAESRIETLVGIHRLLMKYRRHILAIRIGATDLSAAYGLRRSRALTAYDIRIVADVITDVVNIFGRTDGTGFVITGPVWEYFSGAERIFKPQLRETPFAEHSERALRARLIAKDLDGLIREVVLDHANGLIGKSVIHPTHVAAVHALSVVSHEEYRDAMDILSTEGAGGAAASSYRNKMNESKPHTAWAERMALRGHVFGVTNEDTSFVDLLGAGLLA
jgi:citrate lyase beta subunit